jgi:hypothetical protein
MENKSVIQTDNLETVLKDNINSDRQQRKRSLNIFGLFTCLILVFITGQIVSKSVLRQIVDGKACDESYEKCTPDDDDNKLENTGNNTISENKNSSGKEVKHGLSNKSENDAISENSGEVRQTYRPEIDLLLNTLKIIRTTGKRQLQVSDYPPGFFGELKRKADEYDSNYILSEEIKPLFKGETAYNETKEIVYTARKEYLDILGQLGADPLLISEIRDVVFPADDDHLWVSNTDDLYSEYSFVRTSGSKVNENPAYAESYMRFEVGSAWQWSKLMQESGILGAEPKDATEKYAYWRKLREYGARIIFFHEMTHVLQQAYINLKVKKYGDLYSDQPKTEGTMFGLTDSSELMDTIKTPFTESDNLTITKESQAMMMQQLLITKHFNLNQDQSRRVWDYVGGGKRFSTLRKQVAEIIYLSTVANADEDQISKIRYLANSYDTVINQINVPDIKKLLDKIKLLAGVEETSYAIGYISDYNDESVNRIMNGLRKIN